MGIKSSVLLWCQIVCTMINSTSCKHNNILGLVELALPSRSGKSAAGVVVQDSAGMVQLAPGWPPGCKGVDAR